MKAFGFSRFFQRSPARESSQVQPDNGQDGADVAVEGRLRPNPGTTILVVDDSKTIQVVLTRMLSRYGYETLSAYDGDRAVALTREHRPSLVLMDVVMPGMNGFQATREIRKDLDPDISSIPVIIMSGNAQPTEEFWSRKIKANGFIPKPFGDEDLLERIEALLYEVTE